MQKEKIDEVLQSRSKGEVAPGHSPSGHKGGALGEQSRAIHGKSHEPAMNLVKSKGKIHSLVDTLKEGNGSHGGASNLTPTQRTWVPNAAKASHPAFSEMTELTTQASAKRPRPNEEDEEEVSPKEWHEAFPKFQSSESFVEDVMTPKLKVHSVLSSQPMSTVEDLLYLVSGAPVVDECNTVVGVISRSDMKNRCKNLKTYSWRQDPVSKYMSKTPMVVTRLCKIRDAASLLQDHGFYRLPVVDEEQKLIGIVTRYDILGNYLETGGKQREQIQNPKVYTEHEKLEMLRQWVKKNGSADRRMPTSKENWLVDGKEDQPFGIGRWLNRLKGRVMKEFRRDPEVSNDGQKLLDGPVCEILGLEPGWWKGEERWERKLAELKTYMETHGEIPRKSKDRNLYHFVSKQREKKESGELSEWRKKKLEQIPGWEWDDGTVSSDEEWEQKYRELEEFLNANDKCIPTLQSNNVLYWFLEEQRRSHSKGFLPRQRIDKLDALIGIGWWSKESQNDAQLLEREAIVEEIHVGEDEAKETDDASLPNETDVERNAADALVDLLGSRFDKRPAKNPHKQPITDPKELKELKDAGLTSDGEKRIMGADTRCRPSAALKNLFNPKFPEFRLPNAVSSAKAEDIVNIWAMLANVTPSKEVPFNFDADTYLKDKPLMEDLRKLIPKDGGKADPEPVKEFLKMRFKSRSLIMKRKAENLESEGMGDSKCNEQVNSDAIEKSLISPAQDVNSAPRQRLLNAEDRHSFRRPRGEKVVYTMPHDVASQLPACIADETSLQQADCSVRFVAPDAIKKSKDGMPENSIEGITREEKLKALEIRWSQGHEKSSFQQIPVQHSNVEKNAGYDLEDGKGPRKFNLGKFVHHEIISYKVRERTKEQMEELVTAMHLNEDAKVKFWNRCEREKEKAKERSELLMALEARWQNCHTDPGFKEIPVQNLEEAKAMYDLGDGKGLRKFNLGLSISTEIQSYKKGKRQDEEMEELAGAMHLSEEASKAFWERCKKENAVTDVEGFVYPEKRQRKKVEWLVNLEKVKEYPLPSEWPTKGDLGSWLRHQKKNYIDNTLASEPGKDGTSKEEKRRLLEELPGWSDHIKPKTCSHFEKGSAESLREMDPRFNTLLRVLEEWKTEQTKVSILKRKHVPAQRDMFIDSETGETIKIGQWIQNYKKSAKNGVLESIEKLAEIGKLLGIGGQWWQSKSPYGAEEESQLHKAAPMDQDEELKIDETPDNENDHGVLPNKDIKDASSHEAMISIPQKLRDLFVRIENDITTCERKFGSENDYIELATFYSGLYTLTKDNVFKWAQTEIHRGRVIDNYFDAYLTFILISGDVKDNELEKVIRGMKERAKQKEVKQGNGLDIC
eukprot:jgi/Picsp_1/6203/NSC_03557-R1_anti-sigma regulatory serine threonine protein kinase